MGKHRDLGLDASMGIRWVNWEGDLVGKTHLVRRAHYGLPPIKVAVGESWLVDDE